MRPRFAGGTVDLRPEEIVRLENDRVVLLDQRRLPDEEVELECRTAAEVAEAIRTMAVRGAPAIGVAAAYGYALAAAVNYLVQPAFGWRAVFFVGILPAFLTIWVRRSVKEPDIWRQATKDRPHSTLPMLFANGLAPLTIALTIMNACTLFGWWSFNLWLPSFLQEPASRGGLGLQMLSSSTMILVMQLGMWLGYITFGFVSDRIGRKRTYIAYLLLAAVLLFLYVSIRAPLVLLALGPLSGWLSALVLSLYISSEDVRVVYEHPLRLLFICPLLLYWISRIWLLAARDALHDDPVVFALKDRPSYVIAALAALFIWFGSI